MGIHLSQTFSYARGFLAYNGFQFDIHSEDLLLDLTNT